MKYDNRLLTNFLDECNIQYKEGNGKIGFNYNDNFFISWIVSPVPIFKATLNTYLDICTVDSFEIKKYLKIINQLNGERMGLLKFLLFDDCRISVVSEVPIDSTPEMDDLIPGLVKALTEARNFFLETIKSKQN